MSRFSGPGWRLALTVGAPVVAAVATVMIFARSPQAQDQPQGPGVLPPAQVQWDQVGNDYNMYVSAKAERNKGFLSNPKEFNVTPIPILLPDADSDITSQDLVFYSFPDGYDINMPQSVPGLKVLLSGNRVFVQADKGTLSQIKYDRVIVNNGSGGQVQPVIFSQTEDGWLASFARYGMSYTAEVTCDSPQAMSYCQNDAYIRTVASSLDTVVMGQRALRDFNAAQNGGQNNVSRPTRIDPNALKRQLVKPNLKAQTLKPVGK